MKQSGRITRRCRGPELRVSSLWFESRLGAGSASDQPHDMWHMGYPASNAVFRLVATGLVVIEHEGEPEQFTIIRPASLAGTSFFEAGYTTKVGTRGTTLLTDAPPVSLRQLNKRGSEWEVDISLPAAPGPGPVWFRQRFADAALAVEAIRDCFFGDRIDFESEALWPQYRRSRRGT